MIRIRQAAVAGSFYPADTGELSSDVQRLLDAVPPPRALVGYGAWMVVEGSS